MMSSSFDPEVPKRRGLSSLVLALAAVPLLAAVPAAAQQGTVTGIVVSARSLVGIAGAQVTVQGTQMRAVTDPEGRFRLTGLSGAEATLVATRIGFRPTTQAVRVGASDVRILLTESALALDEIVVTGTAGGEEKRAIGNAVATINASDQQQIAPVTDFTSMINGRAAGVVFIPEQGITGGAGRIRIRGTSSLSLENEPLVYIDGVRVDNQSGRGFTWGSTSRINDIDPNTIESIEIIKGPAAATLYGTEASNGVIQIITKKGTAGAARVTAHMSQGATWVTNQADRFDNTVSYFRDAAGELQTLNLVRVEQEAGRPLFTTGHSQRYGLDASGGSEAMQYYAAGFYDNLEGTMQPDQLRRWSGRANFTGVVNDKLTVSANGGFVSQNHDVPYHELLRGAFNPVPAVIDLANRGFLVATPEALRAAYNQVEDVSRFTGGISVDHRPLSWFSHRLNVGVDEVNEEATTLTPRLADSLAIFFGPQFIRGSKTIIKRELTTSTLDYSATASVSLTDRIISRTSGGLQYYRRFLKNNSVTGIEFPAPGVTTISSAAVTDGNESFVENVTFGGYFQQQFGLNNRLFVTGAFRMDDNSAFGRDFSAVVYPKFSGAWVMSEEPFWPAPVVSTLRLRGAYGQSGQQPDAFAAVRSYQPITGPGGGAAVRPQFVGNPDLGPEKGAEIELGFDAGLFDERVNVEFTFYDKRSKNAILARPVAPSTGFIGNQFVNIGEIQNKGWESLISFLPVAAPNVRVDLSFSLSHNVNKIIDLGGFEEIPAVVNQYHREGFPVAAYFEKVTVGATIDPATGMVDPASLMCDAGIDGAPGGPAVPCAEAGRVFIGSPIPDYEGAINTDITLFDRLTLSGLLDFKFGQSVFSADLAIQCTILRLCEPNVDPASDPVAAGEMAQFVFGPYVTPDVGFAKLRQISASYRFPERWIRSFGGSSATLTVSARNIRTFTGYNRSPEPELATVFQGSQYQPAFNAVPHPFVFESALRITF